MVRRILAVCLLCILSGCCGPMLSSRGTPRAAVPHVVGYICKPVTETYTTTKLVAETSDRLGRQEVICRRVPGQTTRTVQCYYPVVVYYVDPVGPIIIPTMP